MVENLLRGSILWNRGSPAFWRKHWVNVIETLIYGIQTGGYLSSVKTSSSILLDRHHFWCQGACRGVARYVWVQGCRSAISREYKCATLHPLGFIQIRTQFFQFCLNLRTATRCGLRGG